MRPDALAEIIVPGVRAHAAAAAEAERAASDPATHSATLHSAVQRLVRRLLPGSEAQQGEYSTQPHTYSHTVSAPAALSTLLHSAFACDPRTAPLLRPEMHDVLAALMGELFTQLQPLMRVGSGAESTAATAPLFRSDHVEEEACTTVRAFVGRRERAQNSVAPAGRAAR